MAELAGDRGLFVKVALVVSLVFVVSKSDSSGGLGIVRIRKDRRA